jgi:glutathione S-transferase
MPRLYDNLPSGNGYKCRLLLTQLGIAFERIELDLQSGASRTAEYLAKNPNGRIPMLELDDGRRLAESDAILWYLGDGTPFVPEDKFERAQVLQWMFFEQYSHEPYVAVLRALAKYRPANDPRLAMVDELRKRGYAALQVMDQHLAARSFFVGERYSIADIALYAYTHVAPEGGFDLAPFPSLRAWLGRVAAQERHIVITEG